MAQVRAEAVRSVKADLALRALADAEEIEVTDDELDAELAAMAERMDGDHRPISGAGSTAPGGLSRYARSNGRPRR